MANLSQSMVLLNFVSTALDSDCLFMTYSLLPKRLSPKLISSEYTKNEAGQALGKNKGENRPHETHKDRRDAA